MVKNYLIFKEGDLVKVIVSDKLFPRNIRHSNVENLVQDYSDNICVFDMKTFESEINVRGPYAVLFHKNVPDKEYSEISSLIDKY